MKLREALDIVNSVRGKPSLGTAFVACGFTPLHLPLYLKAHYLRRSGQYLDVESGLYGDLFGNVLRAADARFLHRWVTVEWSDLDARLGLRSPHGWRQAAIPDMVQTAGTSLARLAELILEHTASGRWLVSLPTLPLPPVFATPSWQASTASFELVERVAEFGGRLAACEQVCVLNSAAVDQASGNWTRHSVRDELANGYPYTLDHTHQLAKLLVELAIPDAPLRGVITDLDNTLWQGIVGDDGVDGIHWDLDHHAGAHGLYQAMLASLADIGVLVAIASKNDPAVASRALARPDMVLNPEVCHPVEVHWQAKSVSVANILAVWNIHPDVVAFIDDSEYELAEVQRAFPSLNCWRFPTGDDAAIASLLWKLRDRFGKARITEEDRLRANNLRTSLHQHLAKASDAESFLRELQAEVRFDSSRASPRSLELINKTNQFNLNGHRWSEQQWRQRAINESCFLVAVDYRDKFGPMGKIAVIAGWNREQVCVDAWALSCRAFSRRIEFAMLEWLFEVFQVDEVQLDFRRTNRNGPFQEFLTTLGVDLSSEQVRVRKGDLVRAPKFHGSVVRGE